MSETIKHVTDSTYQADVLEAKGAVLVDFWAPWCGPCRIIGPVVEELADEYAGRFAVAKVNTDENQATPGSLGIRGIPTLLFYVGGREVDRVVGVRRKDDLQAKMDAILTENEA
jgi:thioredoxin 1